MKKNKEKGIPLKVDICLRNRLFAEGLRQLLGSEKDLSVMGTFSEAAEWKVATRAKADILITDLHNFHALSNDLPQHGSPKVLLIWDLWQRHPNAENLQELLSKGIAGIIPPESTVALLIKSIWAVSKGELWLNRTLMKKVIAKRSNERPELTIQEKKVVELICQGNRNKEIANKLGIAEQTVKAHCNRIYKKLGVTDRLELALYGYQNGEGSDHYSH